MCYVLFTVIILVVAVIGVTEESFGECPTCVTEPHFEMNNDLFVTGEKLIITGVVPVLQENVSIIIQISDSNNKIYVNEAMPLNTSNFQFEHVFCDNHRFGGMHTIKVDYFGRTASNNFNYVINTSSDDKYYSCVEESSAIIADKVPSKIPKWIKNSAGWWANDDINDAEFLQGMKFLIEKEIIIPTVTSSWSPNPYMEIPSWIKNSAGWWANDDINDQDFLKGIDFLIENQIIVL